MRWILLMVLGCGGKSSDPPPLPEFDEATDSADTGADADSGEPEADFCDDAPNLSWNNFGQGFLTEACQGCHATAADNRYGAPDEVVFDTAEVTWAQADRILARATGDFPSMPPLGGTSATDRQKLEIWLRCSESGS